MADGDAIVVEGFGYPLFVFFLLFKVDTVGLYRHIAQEVKTRAAVSRQLCCWVVDLRGVFFPFLDSVGHDF